MYILINLIINLYFAVSFFVAGCIFSKLVKIKDEHECKILIDSLFYGCLWVFIVPQYFNKKYCEHCKNFKENRCLKTGRFHKRLKPSCEYFERKKK